jgi:hypothetical protein
MCAKDDIFGQSAASQAIRFPEAGCTDCVTPPNKSLERTREG